MASNFDLNSALIAIELWGSFSVPHLLWHGSSVYVYDGQIRRPMTHTCCRAFSRGSFTTCFNDLCQPRPWFEHPTLRMQGSNHASATVKSLSTVNFDIVVLLVLFCFCLFVVLRPAREFFIHMETSPSLVKGFKFLPMLGTYGHWAVRVLQRATLTVISIKQWTVLCYLSRDQIPNFLVQGNLFHFMDNARWEIRT